MGRKAQGREFAGERRLAASTCDACRGVIGGLKRGLVMALELKVSRLSGRQAGDRLARKRS
jgi:hypothetical protein